MKDAVYHYTLAVHTDSNRITPLIRLGTIYAKNRMFSLAYMYSKYAVEFSIPNSYIEISVMEYKFHRWYNLAMTSFYLGKFNEARDALQHIQSVPPIYKTTLQKLIYEISRSSNTINIDSRSSNTINSIDMGNIEDGNIINVPNSSSSNNVGGNTLYSSGSKKILVFGGYYYYKWDGNSINGETGLGGAETVAVRMSEELAKRNYNVILCCNTDKCNMINDVLYIPLSEYDNILRTQYIDYLYIFRHPDKLCYNNNIGKVILSIEDLMPVGNQLPTSDKLSLVCKTQWHKNFVGKYLPQVKDQIAIIGNGIDIDRFRFTLSCIKQEWRFIYSSCPTRGLHNLSRLWDTIKILIPDAELHVFVDFNCPYYKPKHKIPELHKRLKSQDGVILHNRVSQKELAKQIMQSDIWLYPTSFQETFCITAVEMQMGNVLCIYTECGALPEIIGDRGIMLSVDPNKEENDINFIRIINNLKQGKINRNQYLQKAKKWSENITWENACEQFVLKLL